MLDRGPQFTAEMIRELNGMLGIETKLLTLFHSQIDSQTERMNQELEQYLRFFINHRQKDWPEWLALAEFAIDNKIYFTTKVSPFMANYGRKLRRKGKMEKAMEFAERMRRVQKKAGVALKRVQEEMKRQMDRGRKEAEVWKVGDKVMLSTKDFVMIDTSSVIAQGCGQTLGLGLVDKNRTVGNY